MAKFETPEPGGVARRKTNPQKWPILLRGGWAIVLGVLLAGCSYEPPPGIDPVGSASAAAPSAAQGAIPPTAQANAPPAKSSDAPLLRYGWKQGQTYKYRVKVEADKSNEVEELKGEPQYTVISVSGNRVDLTFQGMLHEVRRMKPNQPFVPFGGPPPIPSLFSPLTGAGPGFRGPISLTVTPQGNITRQEGTSQLPFLLGNLSDMMLERLPDTPQKTWSFASDSAVIVTGDRFPFPRFSPLAHDARARIAAKESASYSIESVSGKLVTIRKQYDFRTATINNEKPLFEVTGSGKVVFDTEQGMPSDCDFSLTMVARQGNMTIEIPVKFTYRLFDQAELTKMAEDAKREEAERKRPLGPGEIDTMIADLESNDAARVRRASELMAEKKPQEPNAKMTKALENLVATHQEAIVRANAAKALESWATPESVPVLLKAVVDFWPPVRASAMRTLGKLKAKKAIKPIAERLQDLADRGPASEFLKAMGSDAEDATLKQLAKGDDWVKPVACSILKEIGTEKSVPALEKAVKSGNHWVNREARAALEAIRLRAPDEKEE